MGTELELMEVAQVFKLIVHASKVQSAACMQEVEGSLEPSILLEAEKLL